MSANVLMITNALCAKQQIKGEDYKEAIKKAREEEERIKRKW